MDVTLALRRFERILSSKEASAEARRLLSHLLQNAGISLPSPLPIEKEQSGRPYLILPAGLLQIDFNLSHAGNCVACCLAVAEVKEVPPRVGIDIEIPHPRMNCMKIAGRFFSPSEIEFLHASDDLPSAFLDVWTKKEAYLKFVGTGLSGGMREADTLHPDRLSPPVRFITYRAVSEPAVHITLCLPPHIPAPKLLEYSAS